MAYSILCVEDDLDIANLVSYNLSELCDQFDHVSDGKSASVAIQNNNYDVLILDLMLPDINGLQICENVRKTDQSIPIIMLTSCSSDHDCIRGLESGADDYVTKPFNVLELRARVKAALRRQSNLNTQGTQANNTQTNNKQANNLIIAGDLEINLSKHLVKRNKKIIDLTSKEFDLLIYFSQHSEQVFSRSQLLDAIWGVAYNGYDHTVNSHINRLRRKLEPFDKDSTIIQTIWGVGYKLSSESCQ